LGAPTGQRASGQVLLGCALPLFYAPARENADTPAANAITSSNRSVRTVFKKASQFTR
jgi:hypothetical protein